MQFIKNLNSLLEVTQSNQLIRALKKNYIFIVPNNRLSISLKEQLNTLLCNENKELPIWVSPSVYPFNDFIIECWNQALSYGLIPPQELIQDTHALIFWEEIIKESNISNEIQSIQNLAKEVQKNYNELRQYLIDRHNYRFEFMSQVDSSYFYEWIDIYEKKLKKKKLVTNIDAQMLLLNIDHQNLKNKIIIMGFNQPTPLQYSLLKKFSLDSTLNEYQLKNDCCDISYSEFDNKYDEIFSSAMWAKDLLKKNKNYHISVVFQDLESNKIIVERIFSDVFSSDTDVSKNMFNISSGINLDKTHLVSDAILIIKTLYKPLRINEWIKLFKSPYIQGNTNLSFYNPYMIDLLFAENIHSFQLSDIFKLYFKNKEKYQNEVFESIIRNAMNFQRNIKKNSNLNSNPSEWVNIFVDYLKIFSWPFISNLESNEYQQYVKFKSALDSFGSYDSISPTLNLNKSITLLFRHLGQQIFHPETVDGDHRAIQILGGLEASGQIFDYTWFIGISEKKWPRSIKKFTLIPQHIQVDNSIIPSNYDFYLEYFKKLTQNYVNSSKNIIISFSKSKDDLSPKLSRLFKDCIKDLDLKASPEILNYNSDYKYTKKINNDDPFEYIPEIYGLPCNKSMMSNTLHGGSYLIKDHNINPLRAYVKWRLGIQPQILRTEIISNLDRGKLIHKALEIIWEKIGSSEKLKHENTSSILDLISTSLDNAFDYVFTKYLYQPKEVYQLVEKKILQISIFSLLKIESKRPNFHIESLEYKGQYSHKGFNINLQIDRVDRLGLDDYLLIDYKLNYFSNKGWYGEYLTDPQLPLYLLVFDSNSKASKASSICYSFIRLNKNQGFFGLTNKVSVAENMNGIEINDEKLWSDQIMEWKTAINNSIEQIIEGEVYINLKRLKSTDPTFDSKILNYNKIYDSFFRFSYSRLISEDDLRKNHLNVKE